MQIGSIREIIKEKIQVFMLLGIVGFIFSFPIGLIEIAVIKTGLEIFKPPYLQFLFDFFIFIDRPSSAFIKTFGFALFFMIIWFVGTLTFWGTIWLYGKAEQQWWNSLTIEEQTMIDAYWTSIDYGNPNPYFDRRKK
jgi:hypothetical protein